MKLYLVRHGSAVDSNVDPERPLSPHGKSEVERVTEFLKRTQLQLGEIYHSTKLRAKQTAQLIQKSVAPKSSLVEKSCLSPNDDIDEILEELLSRNEDLMIVGHLPFLPRLISKLVVGDEGRSLVGLSTAAVVAMYTDNGRDWQIVWVVDPDLIP